MTLARACGVVINGVEGLVVDIEAYLSQGLPGMTIVGLPDTAVGEARDRVRAAVQNSELQWPSERRITVGLSPASVHKRGASLDLGIALSILSAHSQIPEMSKTIVIGELALDGAIVVLISQCPRSTHELAMHFGSEVDFHDLQAALTLLEVRKLILLSNQGWKLVK